MITFCCYETKDGVQCAKILVAFGHVPYGKDRASEFQWWTRDRAVKETLRLGKNYFAIMVPVLRNWPGSSPDEPVKETIHRLLLRLPDDMIAQLAHDLCDFDGSVFHGKSLVENHCSIHGITNDVIVACWPEMRLIESEVVKAPSS
jgi:hypothetical protein